MPPGDIDDAEKANVEDEPPNPKNPEPKVVFGDERTGGAGIDVPTRDRPRGIEMRREITKEDRELAAAGYDHLAQEKNKPKQGDREDFGKVDIVEHTYALIDFNDKLDTHADTKEPAQSPGLSQSEAESRLARDGKNVLTPPKKKSALRKVGNWFLPSSAELNHMSSQYFDCLRNLFNLLLIIAGILEYILLGVDFADNKPNEYLGAILIGVAFLNAFIEFYQLQKSEAILNSFLALIPPTCHVVRDGSINTMPAENLVKGDIVLLRMGDKTPADVVLFSASDLKVDNSSLTGESEPQERGPVPSGASCRPVEAENLVKHFLNSIFVLGSCDAKRKQGFQFDFDCFRRRLGHRRSDGRPYPYR
jgi:sodium/potassium-transporting ATPase subunit alpha